MVSNNYHITAYHRIHPSGPDLIWRLHLGGIGKQKLCSAQQTAAGGLFLGFSGIYAISMARCVNAQIISTVVVVGCR